MIKIIVILCILMFLYFVGLFLYRTFQKNKQPSSEKEKEIYHFDVPEKEEIRMVNVQEEREILDEKKNS